MTYAAIIGVVLVLLLEAFSYVAIAVVSPRLDAPILRTQAIFRDQSGRIDSWLNADSLTLFVVFDSVLGWHQRAGYHSDLYTVGPQGVRGTKVYATRPPAGVLRAGAFGDSFVFGMEVDDSSSWSAVIEREFPGIEVPNYGVGGYGLDQSVLAVSAHGRDLHPQVVIVGYVPDQFKRAVNVYRRFLSTFEPPLVKPRFAIDAAGRLEFVPTPLREFQEYRRLLRYPREVVSFGRMDRLYSPLIYQDPLYDYSSTIRLITAFWIRFSSRYVGVDRLYVGGLANAKSEAFRLQVALFEQAARSIRGQGAEPLFVFFPDRYSLERIAEGQRPSYQSLFDTLQARGLQPIDAAEAFATESAPDFSGWFATAHYSPAGNRIVGLWLGRVLRARAQEYLVSSLE
jgi:hypothetical protein